MSRMEWGKKAFVQTNFPFFQIAQLIKRILVELCDNTLHEHTPILQPQQNKTEKTSGKQKK